MSGPDRDQPVAETSASPAGYYHHHHGGSSSSLAALSQQRHSSQSYRQNPPHPGQLHQSQSQSQSQGARPGEPQSSPDQQQHQQHHQGHGLGSGITNANANVVGNDDNPNDDDPPATTAAAADHESDSASSLPPFEPIFTLLTNTTTNTTVHPRVHYLFSDDDASAVFTAPHADPLHRALVVDLAPPAAPNGKWSVSWASSLTPDFAVTSSQLSLQQHAAAADSGNDIPGSTSVVLRVEGVEREPVSSRPNSLPASGSGIVGRENIEQLVDEFRRRMGVLKKVVDEGERRKEAMARTNEGLHSEQGEDASGAPPAESTGPLVLEDDGTG